MYISNRAHQNAEHYKAIEKVAQTIVLTLKYQKTLAALLRCFFSNGVLTA
ncbi:MAG: hypothetical protein HRU48_13175 [Vibrio sp.]|nr:hypothetical protein [Vibrio sp.]NRB68298.1 hypothetical protein [Vibrio sp.]